MKYFVFTFDGDGLGIAYRLQQEGHDVVVGQVQDKKDILSAIENDSVPEGEEDKTLRLSLFDGMLDKMPADKLLKRLQRIRNRKEYFVFFDFNFLFRYAEEVKKLGFHGNFPTEEDHLLEIDRHAAKEFVEEHYPKMKVAGKKVFFKIKDAIAFLENTQDIWVLKGKEEHAKTFVPKTDDPIRAKEQIIEVLENFKDKYEEVGFILELFIPTMMEITPEKIYYDGEPVALTIMIENKPFGSGNLSVQTGCAADIVFPIPFEERINEIAFPPYIDTLAKKHKGLFFWDASLLISKRDGKIYFGEFCPNRAGYNTSFTEFAQMPNVNHFFKLVIKKKNPFTLGTVATSITLFNLHRHPETDQILSGLNMSVKKEVAKDVWYFDIRKNARKKLVTVGYGWELAVVTGSGKSINEAVQKMYKNIEGVSFVEPYYRPKDDYLSLDYRSSILNRLNYGLERRLYHLPFDVRIGDIKAT